MSAYFVAQITIVDPEEYQLYLDGFDEIFARYRGQVIAVDDEPTVLEGMCSHERFVLIRFPDEAELRRWYESQDYRNLAGHRFRSAHSDVLLVKGRDIP